MYFELYEGAWIPADSSGIWRVDRGEINIRSAFSIFPFAGQESTHHKMIIDLLVLCAQRGMAVWIISSGIDAICEKTDNEEFLRRLHYLNK